MKAKILALFIMIILAGKCIAYDHAIFVQAELPGYNVWLVGYNQLILNRRFTISVDAGGRLLTPAWLTEASADLHYNISDIYYVGLGNTFMSGDMDADNDYSYLLSFIEPQAGVHIGFGGDKITIFAEAGYMWLYTKWSPGPEHDEDEDIVIPSFVTLKIGLEYWL